MFSVSGVPYLVLQGPLVVGIRNWASRPHATPVAIRRGAVATHRDETIPMHSILVRLPYVGNKTREGWLRSSRSPRMSNAIDAQKRCMLIAPRVLNQITRGLRIQKIHDEANPTRYKTPKLAKKKACPGILFAKVGGRRKNGQVPQKWFLSEPEISLAQVLNTTPQVIKKYAIQNDR